MVRETFGTSLLGRCTGTVVGGVVVVILDRRGLGEGRVERTWWRGTMDVHVVGPPQTSTGPEGGVWVPRDGEVSRLREQGGD